MKRICFLLVLVGAIPAFAVSAAEEPEIVIEMQGAPDTTKPQPLDLWTKNARQLTRLWKGKSREELLYTMPIVSDKDRIVHSGKKEYALVEYYNGGEFRKFLFNAEMPQKFVAVAATPEDVFAVNKKYAINLGLTQRAFEKFYGDKVQKETVSLPAEAVLYRVLDAQSVLGGQWVLFEKQQLAVIFETEKEKEDYVKKQDKPIPAPIAKTKTPARRKPYKALLSGGTVQDQMYMPRVVPSEHVSRTHLTPTSQK